MLNLNHPSKVFTTVSLMMIMAMAVGTGLIQASFFRRSIIEREAMIVRDVVNALAIDHHILARDFQATDDPEVRKRFDSSFNPLKKLPDTALIKVFNRSNIIVWSDDPTLLGKQRTTHIASLNRAMNGQVQAEFNVAVRGAETDDKKFARPDTIECYVPIFSSTNDPTDQTVVGVLSLYRDQKGLNRTILQGQFLLLSVIGGMGMILFFALHKLFNVVYSRQKSAESKFSKLTLEHERIVQIEKMSAMGELVGEIAHQLNNPLVGVINLTQLAEREIQNPQRISELLVEVRKAGTECRDIVQRILRISKISRSTLQPTDITELVQDTITFCQQSIDLRHAVDFSPPEQRVMIDVDPVLIRQALFNLIHNAILASPDTQVHVVLVFVDRDGINGIQLSVTDAGPGFDSETAAKLFKPFFTTRTTGTGLGLSVAQHIVMKHGGVVLARNLPEGGARFSIWLPVTTKP